MNTEETGWGYASEEVTNLVLAFCSKHYYGYGSTEALLWLQSVIDVRESFRDSCVLESKQVGRVLAGWAQL
jgi:hypothetical protein